MMPRSLVKWLSITVAIVLLGGVAWFSRPRWLPQTQQFIKSQLAKNASAKDASHEEEASHEGHDHGHAGHDESNSIHLSDQARRNVGLTDEKLKPIELKSFTRMLDVPARVVERPGRTRIQVGAPMTGVVTTVNALQGESIRAGTQLFTVRLTHEDLVQAQTVFLQTLGELDVEKREIARLNELDERGVIAGKTLLEREYSKQKLEAVLNAHREALLLHGLSEEQVDRIAQDRRLLRELEVRAPGLHPQVPGSQREPVAIVPIVAFGPNDAATEDSNEFMVQTVNVQTGTMVQAGDPLCVLADLAELYIEGRGFEQDADEISHAARMQAKGEPGWGVVAVTEDNNRESKTIDDLKIEYVDNEVESDSRALRFFVNLRNRVVQDTVAANGHRFVTWRFKPGQRMQLRVPVEKWSERIVLPVDAIAQVGAERYVFQQNGDHFDRVAVHVEYQDQFYAVIANDGSLFPGDVVALRGAHQMQMALKNKAGGGVDPHAGHNH